MQKCIRTLLLQHLSDLNSKIDTIYEGITQSPNLPYQTVYLQPTNTDTHAIADGPLAQWQGYLQITLHAPSNQGTAWFDEQADQISHHFYPYTWLKENLQLIISQPPQIGGLFLYDGHLAMPITLYYTAYQL